MNDDERYVIVYEEGKAESCYIEGWDGTRYGPYLNRLEAQAYAEWIYWD